MKVLVPFFMALAAACSNGQAASQSDSGDGQLLAHSGKATVVPTGRVTDAANIIGPEQEAALTQRLAELEQATNHQMAIVTVKSLNGEDVADFTLKLFNEWGVGRKEHDDGVVVLVAPSERKVRITVGYGLEHALPDTLCRTIIDEHMLPHFREGNLEKGIEAGAGALVDTLTKTI